MKAYQLQMRLFWLVVLLLAFGIYVIVFHPEWLMWFFTL